MVDRDYTRSAAWASRHVDCLAAVQPHGQGVHLFDETPDHSVHGKDVPCRVDRALNLCATPDEFGHGDVSASIDIEDRIKLEGVLGRDVDTLQRLDDLRAVSQRGFKLRPTNLAAPVYVALLEDKLQFFEVRREAFLLLFLVDILGVPCRDQSLLDDHGDNHVQQTKGEYHDEAEEEQSHKWFFHHKRPSHLLPTFKRHELE
mmetsp:Transcript_69121/g.192397  ORF Transcript_69121/g.192397 Transcript_69121/m.192397 type:complete len:202 (+) Transcript_69121:520-1125(+)